MAHYDVNIIYFSYTDTPPKNLKTIREVCEITDLKKVIHNKFIYDNGIGSADISEINASLDVSDNGIGDDRFPNELQDCLITDIGIEDSWNEVIFYDDYKNNYR